MNAIGQVAIVGLIQIQGQDLVVAVALRHPHGEDHLAEFALQGPFGALLRLKAGFTIPANWTTQAKAIVTAMQRYGLYVADIGSDLYVQGDPSAAWSGSTISQIQTLHMSDFEFVDLGAVTRDARFRADSFAASW